MTQKNNKQNSASHLPASKQTSDSYQLPTAFTSNRYQLIEKIGQGGFGDVFLAQDKITQQRVAIKLLRLKPEFDPQQKQRHIMRFQRETHICSKLSHPNIVGLIDKGEIQENPETEQHTLFAVFEYVEGQSLQQRLTQGPIAANEAADIMGQVLNALVHAHKSGVVHRDIKPANIMLVPCGTKTHAKILDFGIGSLTHDVRQQDYRDITLTHEALGTPSYSAPEQLRGEPPSTKTDLYVWALVFIECLTATPAISGNNIASIYQQQLSTANVPLPSALVDHASAPLLRRVLNKKSHERNITTETLYNEFSQISFSNLVGDLSTAKQKEHLRDPSSIRNVTPPIQSIVQSTVPSITQSVIQDTLATTVNNHMCDLKDESLASAEVKEKKTITVMCLTLTSSMKDTEFSDIEIASAQYNDQKSRCIDLAVRYNAVHVGSLGDTLLFYFGYPIATDHDSRLCIRAGLEIISDLNTRNALLTETKGISSKARIGIHSGIVASENEYLPEGDTANIAMALARQTEENQILCTENTFGTIENYVEFDRLPETALGVANKKMRRYAIRGERKIEACGFLQSSLYQKKPVVGREQSLLKLQKLVTQEFRHVHINGEAGIGKSTLVFALRDRITSYAHTTLQCLPEYKNCALAPVLHKIKQKYLPETLSPKQSLAVLSQALRASAPNSSEINTLQSSPEKKQWDSQNHKDQLAVAALWLNIECEPALPSKHSAEELNRLLFDSFSRLLCLPDKASSYSSELLIFEDIHWADPMTISFIQHLRASSQFTSQNYRLISTSRLSLPDRLVEASSAYDFTVNKLDPSGSTELISELFDGQSLSSRLENTLLEHTDGNPLFIEELVTMFIKTSKTMRVNGKVDWADDNKTIHVPHNLRSLLQQNLDLLIYAKETTQFASAIGREFSYHQLKGSTSFDDERLQNDLEELLDTGLVYVQRKVDGDSYLFKHALVRDSAYDSMPKNRKLFVHEQIATAIENDNNLKDSSLLARHWSEAENYSKAVEYGNEAAQFALKRSSASEAISQAQKNHIWIDRIATEDQVDARLRNYGLLTSAYMETKGWGSDEVLNYSQASLDLLASSERYDELVSHLWWKVLNGIVGGRRTDLSQLSCQMGSLIDKVSPINRAAIKCAQGFYHFTDGDRQQAIQSLQSAIEDYQVHYSAKEQRQTQDQNQSPDHSHQQTFGFDICVFSQATIARAYADQNDHTNAIKHSSDALALARKYQHIPSIGISLMYYGIVHQHYNNKKNVESSSSELIAISEKYDLPIYRDFGLMLHDWSQGSTEKCPLILDRLTKAGSRHGLGHFQSFYADTFFEQENYREAIKILEIAIHLDESIHEENYIAYLQYKKLKALIAQGSADKIPASKEIEKLAKNTRKIALEQNNHYILEKLKTIDENLAGQKIGQGDFLKAKAETILAV